VRWTVFARVHRRRGLRPTDGYPSDGSCGPTHSDRGAAGRQPAATALQRSHLPASDPLLVTPPAHPPARHDAREESVVFVAVAGSRRRHPLRGLGRPVGGDRIHVLADPPHFLAIGWIRSDPLSLTAQLLSCRRRPASWTRTGRLAARRDSAGKERVVLRRQAVHRLGSFAVTSQPLDDLGRARAADDHLLTAHSDPSARREVVRSAHWLTLAQPAARCR
jgi:hypothetical protein